MLYVHVPTGSFTVAVQDVTTSLGMSILSTNEASNSTELEGHLSTDQDSSGQQTTRAADEVDNDMPSTDAGEAVNTEGITTLSPTTKGNTFEDIRLKVERLKKILNLSSCQM